MDALTKQDDGLVRQVTQCERCRLLDSPEAPCDMHASKIRTRRQLLRPPHISDCFVCLASLASSDGVAVLCAVVVSMASSQPALACVLG